MDRATVRRFNRLVEKSRELQTAFDSGIGDFDYRSRLARLIHRVEARIDRCAPAAITRYQDFEPART
jgi:hypothetical protein